MKLKRGKALTSTKIETVPLSGDTIEFLQKHDTTLPHAVANVWKRVYFDWESQTVKYLSLASSVRFSVLHSFHFLSSLSPSHCFRSFLLSSSSLFHPFCLVSLPLVSFCPLSVFLHSFLVFQL